jgi:hypothetical protein
VRHAFRKYGRIRPDQPGWPGEVMFDEVQALLRDKQLFLRDDQLEAFTGMTMGALKRAQELSTPIGIDFDNFQDLYLGLLNLEEHRKSDKRPDVLKNLDDMRASPTSLRSAYKDLDKGGKGYLVLSDMREFVSRYGFRVPPGMKPIEFITQMYKKADTDGDGFIQFEEFVDLVNSIVDEAKKDFFGMRRT